MKPLDGDARMLLRAGQRCSVLAFELDRLAKALGGAADGTVARWSGTAAASFGAMADAHRGTVEDARVAVERLGVLTTHFGHELADAQGQTARLPEGASAERTIIEHRISLLRRRFRQQSMHVESALQQLLLRCPVDPPRWTGPIRPPVHLSEPPISISTLPASIGQGPRAARLPWAPPWLNGAGDGPRRTLIQPVGIGA